MQMIRPNASAHRSVANDFPIQNRLTEAALFQWPLRPAWAIELKGNQLGELSRNLCHRILYCAQGGSGC